MPEERASSSTGAELTQGAAEVTSEQDVTRPVGERAEDLARDRTAGAVEPGGTLGRYMILRPLGSGGGAHACAAADPERSREGAVKAMCPAPAEGRDAAGERLLREAQAMARLEHVNVARVYDVGVVEGRVYMAMELVRGDNLEEWLARRKRTWKETVRVMIRAGR